MDIPSKPRQIPHPAYSNFSAESSFTNSGSADSRTPLTADRESPTTPNGELGHDIGAENPYELPMNFEVDRRRHESEMLERRANSHKKKACLVYEPTSVATNKRNLQKQLSDEEDGTEVRYLNHHAKTYKCTFIFMFILIVLSWGMSIPGILAYFVNGASESMSQTSKVAAITGRHYYIILA